MVEDFRNFRKRHEATIAAQLEGNSEPYLALWSHKPDIMIFGGLGGREHGWPEVGERLRWAATKVRARLVRIENLMTSVHGEMAITADLEHMIRIVDGQEIARALRVTQGYRVENGEWRVFYRHGDEYRDSGRSS
jgi:hypothetical protein